jgi:Endonuclease-reverse transcriptase
MFWLQVIILTYYVLQRPGLGLTSQMAYFLRQDITCIGITDKLEVGGVALFVRQSIAVQPVVVSDEFDMVELVCLDMSLYDIDYRVIGFYRSPGHDSESTRYMMTALRCLRKLCATHRTVVILGDFNLPEMDWLHYCSPDINMYAEFLNFVNAYGLHQLVNMPTRGDNILDIVLSTTENLASDVCTLDPLSNSDHSIVVFKVPIDIVDISENRGVPSYIDFKRGDYSAINSYLSSCNGMKSSHTVSV